MEPPPSLKEQLLKDRLDKMFGNRESAKDIKYAIYLAEMGKINEEQIQRYKEQKERELEEIRSLLPDLNPTYAYDYPTETPFISPDNVEKENVILPESE